MPDPCASVSGLPEDGVWEAPEAPGEFLEWLVAEVRAGTVRAFGGVVVDQDGNAIRVFCESHRMEADLFPGTADFAGAALAWLREGGARTPRGLLVYVLRDVAAGCLDGSLGRFTVALTRSDHATAQFVCQSPGAAGGQARVARVAGDVFGLLDAVLARRHPVAGPVIVLGDGMAVRVFTAPLDVGTGGGYFP